MIEPSKHEPDPVPRHEAINISDFVYAATGARVRRLTMPDGAHWFPAVDVCKELGLTNPKKALADHVPAEHRENLETVSGAYGLSIPAGREWRRDLNLIDSRGLALLIINCTKPASAPFKQWVAEVIETVQREGSYSLDETEVQCAGPGAQIAYAMPEQVAGAITRLAAHSLQVDEGIAVAQRESLAVQRDAGGSAGDAHRATGHRPSHGTHCGPTRRPDPRPPSTHCEPFRAADHRSRTGRLAAAAVRDAGRLSGAVMIAPVLVERGELRQPPASIAVRTELPVHRAKECLRLLRKHACIHSRAGQMRSRNRSTYSRVPDRPHN